MANNLTFKRQFASIHHVVPAAHFGEHVIVSESSGGQFITGPAITKLAAYEALGMEPHEVEEMIRECKAAHATKLLECEVCGMKFEPTKERHYVVNKDINVLCREVLLGDAFDCPKCGCQMVVGERKTTYEKEEE